MPIVHYGHSCVLLETGPARLLIDPGVFSSGFETVDELTAVLITHQHPDHLDQDRLPGLLDGNPGVRLYADPGSAEALGRLGLACTVVTPGEEVTIGGIKIEVIGGDHAVIYADLPGIPNVGYLIDDGAFLHPGDSFVRPDRATDVLGVPTAAPWLKLSEAIDYVRAVAPRVVLPIHEALLVPQGVELMRGWIERAAPDGTTLVRPVQGEHLSI